MTPYYYCQLKYARVYFLLEQFSVLLFISVNAVAVRKRRRRRMKERRRRTDQEEKGRVRFITAADSLSL